ncbi:glycosyltransferase family 39 protein [Curtobacterium sp. ISL-83]|uniref:glycosyltransferase family 39 protein n=1 Tax=Curtobacterium sp. ISL-83 TaxID=2819145 RepID=UPI001BE538AC|nr:glycosyltransferase family 39 protein [Curtobacterium sp. ISL-83]MBT2501568.1 hypothetical protein [Curtobacterium sp. ISL-83]
MSTPGTGSFGVPTRAGRSSVRARARSLSSSVGLAVVRTPELTIGALGVLVSAAFGWVPSLWYDEAATVTSAQRSWGQLWAELHNVDAVHGLYYALMHVWFWLVGYTPFTLRFPSALAIGLAAGLVVALGRRLGGRRLGITAGLVFLAIPRVQWAGSEGRPYATITTLAVGLTLVGLTAVSRTRSGTGTGAAAGARAGAGFGARARAGAGAGRSLPWWIAYGLLALVSVTFNVYLSLAVVAHAVTLGWTLLAQRAGARTSPRSGTPRPSLVPRSAVVRWAVAVGIAAVVLTPFVLEVAAQSKQVSWIPGIEPRVVQQVFDAAWFGGIRTYAAVAWTLMALGTVTALVQAHRAAPTVRALFRAQAVRVALPLVVVPTGALLLATALGKHLYSPKYASLSMPFVALLMALALTLLSRRALLAVAVAVVLLGSVPTAAYVKTPQSKQDSTWAEAASIVAAARAANPAQADEGVVFGSVWKHQIATADIIRIAYPTAFLGMTDLSVRTVATDHGVLWDKPGDVRSTIPARLADIDTVFFVGGTSATGNIEPQTAATLAEHGFTRSGRWTTGHVVVSEYVRR